MVTGGGTGIGLATAKRFVDEGAFVHIFGRRQEKLDAALATLGDRARAVQGSVSDLADLDRLYATRKAERGGVDILFAMPAPARSRRWARSRPTITTGSSPSTCWAWCSPYKRRCR